MAMFGDGLSVRVSANTRGFQRNVENASDKLRSFGGTAVSVLSPLQILQGRADEAADEMADVGRESAQAAGGMVAASGAAGQTSRSFTALTASTHGLSFSVGTLSGALTTALIPALVLLSTVLVPLTAAFAGFATIAGAIAGVGIVGTIGAIANHTEMLKEAVLALVNEALEVLAPAFEMAREVLFVFINEFRQILPELVPGERMLSRLGGAFADLGETLIEAIPAFADLAIALTSEFLPPFNVWLSEMLPKVPGLLRGFIGTLQEVWPQLQSLTQTFIAALPAINEFGQLMLTEVVPAVNTGIKIFANFLDLLRDLHAWWTSLPSWLRTGIFVAAAAAVGILSGGLIGLVAAFSAVFVAWTKLKAFLAEHGVFETIGGAIDTVVSKLKGLWEWLLTVTKPLRDFLDGVASVAGPTARTRESFQTAANFTGAVDRGQLASRVREAQAGGGGRGPDSIRITVEGDTEVVKEVSAETVQDEFESREGRRRSLAGRGAR